MNWGGRGSLLFAACAGGNCAGDQAGLHDNGSATTDNSGGGHWAAGQGSVGN